MKKKIQFAGVTFYVCLDSGDVFCHGRYAGTVDLRHDIRAQVIDMASNVMFAMCD